MSLIPSLVLSLPRSVPEQGRSLQPFNLPKKLRLGARQNLALAHDLAVLLVESEDVGVLKVLCHVLADQRCRPFGVQHCFMDVYERVLNCLNIGIVGHFGMA